MLTFMRLQELRHDLATEKQQQHLFEIEFSSGYILKSGISGSYTVVLFLVFKGNFIMAAPIYISINSLGGFSLLHTLSRIYYL